jgi:hypothetical protein
MPAKSEAQRRFMEICIHGRGKAKGKCPSVKDAKKVLGQGEKKGKK